MVPRKDDLPRPTVAGWFKQHGIENPELHAQRVYRIGVQALWRDPATGLWYASIQNRTYTSVVPVAEEKVEIWKNILKGR